ncbi:MAG: TatD family deoxyribonuclease [Ignavibacteriae bacterium]|nr:MAG: TatD family deoxyribonuclease [Ignavibacteriota bacterium]
MIDSHAHIDTKAFDEDRDAMLERAWAAGLTAIIVPDIEPPRRPHLKQVVDSDPRIFRGVGVHPHHVGEITEAELDVIEAQCTESKVVAIGEIGLDYYYDFCPPDVQKSYFRAQIRIAKRHGLPVIVHNRESDADVLDILEDEQDGTLQGVLHCFSSGLDTLERALSIGMHVSFTGNITFKRSTLDDVVKAVPEDRFMIETDSPYITPVPHRGTRNEPAHVGLIAHKIAELKQMDMEHVIALTSATAKRFFSLTLAMIALVTISVAQPAVPIEDDYPDDRDWEIALDNYYADSVAYEKWIRPRTIGFGISYGTNTVVELQQFMQRYDPTFVQGLSPTDPRRWTNYERDAGPERSFSFEGLSTFGATLTYALSSRFVVEGTWMYSENTGPAEDYGLDPITINVIELTTLYNLNPYSKVNFLPQIGATVAMTDDGITPTTKFGINGGLGIGINIPTEFGLIYPGFNVRFNFMLGTDEDRTVTKYNSDVTGEPYQQDGNPSVTSVDLADVNTIYSIPRLTVIFYPNF